MKLTELAHRLTSAADDLADLRAGLAAEAPLAPPGAGPAQELITMLNAAWADRQADLTALSQEVADLADGVRRAAQGYPAADLRVAEALNPNDFSSLPISAAEPFAPAPKPVAPAPPATSWGQPSLRSGGPLWTL